MRLVTNSGGDRVIDELRQSLQGAGSLALASPQFSLFAFAEMAELLGRLAGCRLVLPEGDDAHAGTD